MKKLSIILLVSFSCCLAKANNDYWTNLSYLADSISSAGGVYKVGEPYVQDGIIYTPFEDYSYNEVGIASWYGDEFHGKRTANGEHFNMFAFTAAHKTLPIPCIVRVTRVSTGKSIIVRINDRGPFRSNRIIDLSWAAAAELGIDYSGLEEVRVQILPEESRLLKSFLIQRAEPRYYVQFFAFRELSNAENATRNDPNLFIRSDFDNFGPLFRVMGGPYTRDYAIYLSNQCSGIVKTF